MNSGDSPLLKPATPFERRVVQAVAAAKPNGSVGVFEKPLPGGRSLTIDAQRSRTPTLIHPFFIKSSGLFHVGLVNSILVPIYDEDPIGPDGNPIDFNEHGGDFLVYLQASFTLTFGTHNFLVSADLIAENPLEIILSPTALTDVIDVDAGEMIAYRWIAQVIDRRVQRQQQTHTNLFLGVCDASDGTPEGKAVSPVWTPEAG